MSPATSRPSRSWAAVICSRAAGGSGEGPPGARRGRRQHRQRPQEVRRSYKLGGGFATTPPRWPSRSDPRGGREEKAVADVDDAVRNDPPGVMPRLVVADDGRACSGARPRSPASTWRRSPRGRRKDLLRDDLRVKNLEGLIDLAESRPEEAIQSWRTGLLEIGGNDAALTWQLAHILLEVGRVTEAEPLINQYRRLVGGDTPDPKYLYLNALATLRSNRPSEAAKLFEAIRSKVPKSLEPHVLFALGQAYESVRDPARAMDNYQQAADGSAGTVGRRPGARSAPGGRRARSEAEATPPAAASTLAPRRPRSRAVVRGAQYLYLDQPKRPASQRSLGEVERLLGRASKAAPGSAQVALFQAEFLANNQRTEDALALLKTACGLSPRVSAIWLARANLLLGMKRPADALQVLGEATKAAGPLAAFYISRATVLIRQGHISDARKALVEGLDRVPKEQKSLVWREPWRARAGQKDYPTGRRAPTSTGPTSSPRTPEPRLALFQLALLKGDEAEMARYTKELRAVAGARSYFWRYARVENLMHARKEPGRPRPRRRGSTRRCGWSPRRSRTNDPSSRSATMLDGRLSERRKKDPEAVNAYRKAPRTKRRPGRPQPAGRGPRPAPPRRRDRPARARTTLSLSTAIEQGVRLQAVRDGDKKAAPASSPDGKAVGGDPCEGLNTRKLGDRGLSGGWASPGARPRRRRGPGSPSGRVSRPPGCSS